MKLGIMQPYFFPYIGYFQLINAVDKWIIFDIIQYMRHHWINRNRILHPISGWQYIIVPLKKYSREIMIKDVRIAIEQDWGNSIIAQLQHYRKKAPYFKTTIGFLKDCFFTVETEEESISKLNTGLLKKTCEVLDIKFNYDVCSEMNLQLRDITAPGDWALEISAQVGAEEYINPVGGMELFNPMKFKEKGIKLNFIKPELIPYKQNNYEFVPDLSIIDVMMWNSTEEIKAMLNAYKIIS
jgi:hypothetical protein